MESYSATDSVLNYSNEVSTNKAVDLGEPSALSVQAARRFAKSTCPVRTHHVRVKRKRHRLRLRELTTGIKIFVLKTR